MSEREPLTPDEARARDAVRGLDRPAADPEFRARLRRQFVSGAFAEAARPAFRPADWHARPATRWAGMALAAAAAFVVVSMLNPAPAWQLRTLEGDGVVVVDGVPVPVAHAADLARRLQPGALVQVPDGVTLELTSPGQLAVQFAPNTEASVPGRPGRWFARSASAELRRGELRVTTGAGFRGARLALVTPEARAEVTGTTFALICEPTGTCLCVMEGTVKIGARAGGPMSEVVEGRRRYLFADGRADETAEMRDTEHVPLGDFLERMRPEMGGEKRP